MVDVSPKGSPAEGKAQDLKAHHQGQHSAHAHEGNLRKEKGVHREVCKVHTICERKPLQGAHVEDLPALQLCCSLVWPVHQPALPMP